MIRHPVADAFDEIRANRDRIRREEVPMCPNNNGRTLHDCLRSSSPCGEQCEYRGDWIGPPEPEIGA